MYDVNSHHSTSDVTLSLSSSWLLLSQCHAFIEFQYTASRFREERLGYTMVTNTPQNINNYKEKNSCLWKVWGMADVFWASSFPSSNPGLPALYSCISAILEPLLQWHNRRKGSRKYYGRSQRSGLWVISVAFAHISIRKDPIPV